MGQYQVVREYPYSVGEVWQVMTDPTYVGQWTTTGQGGRPEGFAAVAGTRFRFVGKPTMGWRGIVDCEVIEVDAPHLLRYTWQGDENGEITTVTYRLQSTPTGTRFTWDHAGFTGLHGTMMAKLLGNVRRKMLTDGVPPVLAVVHSQRSA